MVAFCVHQSNACCCMPETHMLQPMHFADVVEAAFLDLLRQEGVRYRGPGGADDVATGLH